MASPVPPKGKITGCVFVNEQRNVALQTEREYFWLTEQLRTFKGQLSIIFHTCFSLICLSIVIHGNIAAHILHLITR